MLFVGSWFVGARVIEWLVGRAHRVPVLGTLAAQGTRAVGAVFTALTDVTRPVGAATVAIATLAIFRYASQVERLARTPG